ncbi:MAG TPA: hypothetical protein VGM59_16085, partial [Dongiaceae bacterium]
LESDRPECKDLSLRRYDGRNLAFFALQPAPVENGFADTYCDGMPSDADMDRSRQWCDMDQPRVNQSVADSLSEVMPITQSCQDRGIWAKYGTCSLYSPDQYFSRSIKLAKDAASTQVNTKIAGAVGSKISQDALLAAFTDQFGEDSGKAVDFICRKVDGKNHLYQVRITVTLSAMNRGLAKDQLWLPHGSLRRHCPSEFEVDAPPVQVAPAPGTAAPAVSEAPARPGEPEAPQSVPVAPVETAPLPPR